MKKILFLLLLGAAAFGATFTSVRYTNRAAPPGVAPADMVWIVGGEFRMGADSDLAWPGS